VIVLDASAVVEWLLVRPSAVRVAELMADPDVQVHAPSLLGVEVAGAIRGLVLGGHASPDRGRQAIEDFVSMDISLHDPTPLLLRAWELRDNLSAYDAVYVALAEVLEAKLVTSDAKLAGAPGLRVPVDLIGLVR
jgi:predicted nucleic acid-binding protein